ncbi:hypothetical protein I0C86_40580 [Plantactinospora sp. S1510]|uniref:Replication protein n=1 Tax=Plantactinospora alkalitolerans TaxID=2789879 RepID=A0ABS0H9N1_9ACTN|nr:hypothetical protein [Plantactinospora alkalitolerans]MBF9135178.1 hypothetical protein [Plantactinospora alkalitolerans]
MSADERPFRDTYRDAVWESDELSAVEKATAETYARYVRNRDGDRAPDADLAWLDYPTLMAKAGIGRRANAAKTAKGLVEKGWLEVVRAVSRRPTLYRLTIPERNYGSSDGGTTDPSERNYRSSDGGTTDDVATRDRSSDGGTTVVPQWNVGSSDGGTQPRNYLENPPPTPMEINSPSSDESSRDGGDSNLEERKKTIVARVREHRPLWSVPGCLNQINTALAGGREIDLVAEVFLLVAKDPIAQTPKWLNQAHQWWDVAVQRRAGRPTKCGRCDGVRSIPSDPTRPKSAWVGCPACVAGAQEPVTGERPSAPAPPPPEVRVISKATHKHVEGRRPNGQPRCVACSTEWFRRAELAQDDSPQEPPSLEGARVYRLDDRRVS